MLLLDSDVLMDLLSGRNDQRQSEWFKLHPERPHTSALAVAEVLTAIGSLHEWERLSAGKAATTILATALDRRVVPFDLDCAEPLARLARLKRADGTYYPLATLMSAALAARYSAELVTGRPEEYAGLGIATVSP
ncbi:MAG: PIN domain-containing protein [Actinomycetota bacterium]|uniref:type II toxin-antitoxin system VapC family toxin n=1 Tax=Paenarthrobacter sp. PH39-S1 TaxID=3046204 RepID=UPI0024B91A08|nr:PIN domain-containing protein [Paenarthrobacter sp. PH39-S1]MDJ0356544.1 PIN domain-containing protein [Paenarthrobacter sp. PH39-S1]MDQ6741156.1 PIN domain-containing protein [Actinomycetota bacterium]